MDIMNLKDNMWSEMVASILYIVLSNEQNRKCLTFHLQWEPISYLSQFIPCFFPFSLTLLTAKLKALVCFLPDGEDFAHSNGQA